MATITKTVLLAESRVGDTSTRELARVVYDHTDTITVSWPVRGPDLWGGYWAHRTLGTPEEATELLLEKIQERHRFGGPVIMSGSTTRVVDGTTDHGFQSHHHYGQDPAAAVAWWLGQVNHGPTG